MPQVVFGGLVSGPGGPPSMNWPAHPTDMGGDPGLAGGSEVPDAAVAAVRGPQSGMACDCTGAESTDAWAMGWAGTPTKNAKQ